MVNKDKYNNFMMETAINVSKFSYCKRKKVGAVLSKENNIVKVGYNGTISGMENCCEDEVVCSKCDGFGCNHCNNGYVLKTNEFVVHAEQNIICHCAREGISTKDCWLFVTLSPCPNCAKLIVQSGIKKVFYLDDYKDQSGIDFLIKCGVEVSKLQRSIGGESIYPQ